MKLRTAVLWTLFWVLISLCVNVGVYFVYGKALALDFFAAYIVEQSLSIDNLFVFIIIFSSLKIPQLYQRRVLYWGIIGAVILRGLCIVAGVAVLEHYKWVNYIFGLILLYAGFQSFREDDEEFELEKSRVLKFIRRFVPLSLELDGHKFFSKRNGVFAATPLFLALVMVEVSDVIFAIDSIPAVLTISRNEVVVYLSNICAILGLRSLYFVISAMKESFRYLNYGVGVILLYIGIKISISNHYHLPTSLTIGFVLTILTLSILISRVKQNVHD